MHQPSAVPPQRVWIVGACGSGKSTLARAVAARLGVAPVHLDELHFRPGWVERPDEDMLADLAPLLAGERFVVDGNYGRIRRRFLGRVELVVWLDLPFRRSFARLLARTARRLLSREPCCNGNREGWRQTFASRESILWWAVSTHRRRRRELEAELAGRAHVRLRTPGEVQAWLRGPTAPQSMVPGV